MAKNINRRHHVIPSSRRGPDSEWNLCYFRIDPETQKVYADFNTEKLDSYEELKLHITLHTHRFHELFGASLPTEIIRTIREEWTKADGSLNKKYFSKNRKKTNSWITLFGTESVLNTELAVEWLKENKFTSVEGRWSYGVGKRRREHRRIR